MTICLAAVLLMFFVPLAFGFTNIESTPVHGDALEGDPDDYGSPQPGPTFWAYFTWFIIVTSRYVWWRIAG
jgi:hypothetical protein